MLARPKYLHALVAAGLLCGAVGAGFAAVTPQASPVISSGTSAASPHVSSPTGGQQIPPDFIARHPWVAGNSLLSTILYNDFISQTTSPAERTFLVTWGSQYCGRDEIGGAGQPGYRLCNYLTGRGFI